MHALRRMMENELSELTWRDLGQRRPQTQELIRRLMGLGLGAGLCRDLANRVDDAESPEKAWRQALFHLIGELPILQDDLLDQGIYDIYRETLDSSLQMGKDALCLLGFRKYQTSRAAKTFRKHDERFLRELAGMRHDQKELISGVRQRIDALEKLMQTENENIGKDKDLGWDAATLILEFGLVKQNTRNPDE